MLRRRRRPRPRRRSRDWRSLLGFMRRMDKAMRCRETRGRMKKRRWERRGNGEVWWDGGRGWDAGSEHKEEEEEEKMKSDKST